MKTTLTTLLIAVSLICSAQTSLKFTTDNLKEARQLSDSIALNAKRAFKYSSESISIRGSHYFFNYKNVADTTNVMTILFNVKMVGSNPSLEIKGTPQYQFDSTSGKFLDLFPFWKKFINKNEDDKIITNKGTSFLRIGEKRFLFSRDLYEKWTITLKNF